MRQRVARICEKTHGIGLVSHDRATPSQGVQRRANRSRCREGDNCNYHISDFDLESAPLVAVSE